MGYMDVASPQRELEKTVSALTAANKEVYIADDVPLFSFDPQRCKYQRMFSRNNCIEDSKTFYDQYQAYYPILQSIVENNPNARILKITEYFCEAGFCNMAKDGNLLYRDNNHLSIYGSKYVGKKIVENNPQLAN